MLKITSDNIVDIYLPNEKVYLNWATLNEKIINFCNKSTPAQFNYIFDENGDRLWRHFKIDCDSIYQKFRTYLTQDQANILMVSLYSIPDHELYTL